MSKPYISKSGRLTKPSKRVIPYVPPMDTTPAKKSRFDILLKIVKFPWQVIKFVWRIIAFIFSILWFIYCGIWIVAGLIKLFIIRYIKWLFIPSLPNLVLWKIFPDRPLIPALAGGFGVIGILLFFIYFIYDIWKEGYFKGEQI